MCDTKKSMEKTGELHRRDTTQEEVKDIITSAGETPSALLQKRSFRIRDNVDMIEWFQRAESFFDWSWRWLMLCVLGITDWYMNIMR